MMDLAVELINNKTDGWFDELQQVTFFLQVNNSGCDASIAYNAVLDQNKWAKSGNKKGIDGIIGDLCSAARSLPYRLILLTCI